ncbi:MAG: hypothetical protein Q7U37_08310 [Gallionella sp.]|nr:hypothetical protein [Gallionella sp.]
MVIISIRLWRVRPVTAMRFAIAFDAQPMCVHLDQNRAVPVRAQQLRAAVGITCVPGMARNYVGESPAARFSQSRRLGERQGRCREAGSEGS